MSEQHHHPNYKKIYIALVVLLAISVAGPHLGIVWVTLITAFGIALVKANLVVQNFMHLKWEKRIMKWMLATSAGPDGPLLRGRRARRDASHRAPVGEPGRAGRDGPGHRAAPPRGRDGGRPAEGEEPPAAEPATAAAPQQSFDAKGQFETVCATCHGTTGEGNGPGAAALDPKPANFTDPAFWKGKTDAELIKAIREGGASVGKSPLMPAWGALYDQAKAEALLAYLKTLKKG